MIGEKGEMGGSFSHKGGLKSNAISPTLKNRLNCPTFRSQRSWKKTWPPGGGKGKWGGRGPQGKYQWNQGGKETKIEGVDRITTVKSMKSLLGKT